VVCFEIQIIIALEIISSTVMFWSLRNYRILSLHLFIWAQRECKRPKLGALRCPVHMLLVLALVSERFLYAAYAAHSYTVHHRTEKQPFFFSFFNWLPNYIPILRLLFPLRK
jgi:uncharacterized membrane protein YsdA (DUF1294 family)